MFVPGGIPGALLGTEMDEEEKRKVGRRLKECRVAAQLSQEEVAALLGIQRQAVSKWEQGKTLPRSAEWYALGPMYGVSLDYMVYGIRTVPVSRFALMGQIFRQQVAQPSAAASDTPERLPAS